MRLTIAYSKIKKRNLVLIKNAAYYQRETLSERPIRQPLSKMSCKVSILTLLPLIQLTLIFIHALDITTEIYLLMILIFEK